MTLKTLFVPGPRDSLAQHLRAALGPDADLASIEEWATPGGRSQAADDYQALVLGPGAEAASVLAADDGVFRLVQFTGCRQSAEALGTAGALQASGIAVANAGPALAPFVADHTLSLMRAGLSAAGRPEQPIRGLVVGIVGLGNVGIEVARRLRKEGATILYHDIRTAPQGYANEVRARRQTLDRLLLKSDIVTLHVSAAPHTPGLIARRELRLMKPGAVLVNTSVPDALDEAAAASALMSGRLGAVALGIADSRPNDKPSPLARHERVVVNAREATALDGALKAVAALVADNLRRVEAGEPPRGSMDPVGFPGVGDPAFWSSRLAPRRPD